jgi:hypothetical protein
MSSSSNVFMGNIFAINYNGQIFNGARLGKGIPGFIPPSLQYNDDSDENAINRFYLREAFNTDFTRQVTNQGVPAKINSSFRLATNAGDQLSRKNYSCGGSCMTYQSRPGMHGLKYRFGHIQSICDGTGIEPANCNVKYVYDSSDFTKYKKNLALNQTYNNLTNGGDQSHSGQSAIKAVRRY